MIDPEKLMDTGKKVGAILSIAGKIDREILGKMIAIIDLPLSKAMMPLLTQQLMGEAGLKSIPTTEMLDAMKLLAFFLAELDKTEFYGKMKEAVNESKRS
jgi:hypothetical protein